MLGQQNAAHQPAARQRRRVHAAGTLPGARGRPRHDQAALHARAARVAAARARAARCGSSTPPPSGSRSTTSIARLDREGFTPTLILFPEHDADARRRRGGDRRGSSSATARRCSASARTRRRRRSRRWRARRQVDGMFVGEPEDAVVQLARSSRSSSCRRVPSLTWRDAGRLGRPAPRARQLQRLPDDAVPGVGPAGARATTRSRSSTSPTSSSRPAAAARTRATSASRRSTRGTSSASAAPRRWSTRSSAATASSASSSSTSGATRSR